MLCHIQNKKTILGVGKRIATSKRGLKQVGSELREKKKLGKWRVLTVLGELRWDVGYIKGSFQFCI